MTASRPRQPKSLIAGPFQPVINSFRLHLSAERQVPRTIRTYVEAAQWCAAAHLLVHTGHTDWSD